MQTTRKGGLINSTSPFLTRLSVNSTQILPRFIDERKSQAIKQSHRREKLKKEHAKQVVIVLHVPLKIRHCCDYENSCDLNVSGIAGTGKRIPCCNIFSSRWSRCRSTWTTGDHDDGGGDDGDEVNGISNASFKSFAFDDFKTCCQG